MFLVICTPAVAGDTISINNTYFDDPIVDRITIDINKKKIDQSLITVKTDDDENEINTLLVDYRIILVDADTITELNYILNENRSNEVFQIELNNVILKSEKQAMLVDITIKKDGISVPYKRTYNLYYIHNYIRIDSIRQSEKVYSYGKRDTIIGFNNNQLTLFYSVNLNKDDLGIVDIVSNPFYSLIEGKTISGNNQNDTSIVFDDEATDDKNLKFSQNIVLKEGFNKLAYTIYDTDKDWTFSDSIMFFYIKIDDDQQKEFCKSDPITKLKGVPDGGMFRFAENSIGLESGLTGNTNVFDPSRTSDGMQLFNVEYRYRFLHGNQEYIFHDTMQLKVNGLPPDFTVEGLSEVCAFEEGIEYRVVSKDPEYIPSSYAITWNINGAEITNKGDLQLVDWSDQTKSEISVIITDKSTGCSVSKHKFIKVGSNEIPTTIPELAFKVDTEKNNLLLYSSASGNINQYIWYLPDGTDSTTTNNYLLLPATYGNYSLRTAYQGNPGCYSAPVDLTISAATGFSDEFSVYPNPFSGSVTLDLKGELSSYPTVTFTLKNQFGELINNGILPGTLSEIDFSTLPNGIYILSVSNGKKISSQKIVKK
jgi:hypothetical protein